MRGLPRRLEIDANAIDWCGHMGCRARARGRGRGSAGPGGPRARGPVLIDRGAVKTVRAFENDIIVVIVGDLTSDEISRMAASLARKSGI